MSESGRMRTDRISPSTMRARLVDPAGAEDRDLRRHDRRARHAAAQHAEIRQRDGLAAQLGERHRARAATSRFIASSPARRSGVAPAADVAQHRHEQAVARSRSRCRDRSCSCSRRAMPRPSNQALSAGAARQPATMARIRRIVESASVGQASMIGLVGDAWPARLARRARHVSAMARRTPRSGS